MTGGAKWASVESSQAWPQGMFPPPAWQIPSALLKQVSASDEVWAANVENRRSTAELPQSEQAVEFSDCSRRLRTISSNLVPQSKHWYSKIGMLRCPTQKFLVVPATSSLDVAHAFSVPCRAFEPDISESIAKNGDCQDCHQFAPIMALETRALPGFKWAKEPDRVSHSGSRWR